MPGTVLPFAGFLTGGTHPLNGTGVREGRTGRGGYHAFYADRIVKQPGARRLAAQSGFWGHASSIQG